MRVPGQRQRAGQLASKPGRAAKKRQRPTDYRAAELDQIVVSLGVGNHDAVRVVMQETPERVWLTANRCQIEETNGRPLVGLEESRQVGDGAGSTNLARFHGDPVDMLPATDRRSPLGGKCGCN